MTYIPDDLDMFRRKEADEAWEERHLPKCSECEEAIYKDEEHYYVVYGKVYCKNCMEDCKVYFDD